jgi:predicted NUDIX family NTP pyrophosphohydrolase
VRDSTSAQAARAVVRDSTSPQAARAVVRDSTSHVEVLLVHPGGPLWAKKDLGAWSIPKGEYLADEDPLAAAKRELEEETGFRAEGKFVTLGQVAQRSGKIVTAFAHETSREADFDPANLSSNTFSMEWPPRSGRQAEFPEVDRAAWFSIAAARSKILEAQVPFLDRLLDLISTPARHSPTEP